MRRLARLSAEKSGVDADSSRSAAALSVGESLSSAAVLRSESAESEARACFSSYGVKSQEDDEEETTQLVVLFCTSCME